jgi:hypothetical protein
VKETDAIFQNLTEVHRRAAGSEDTLRLSCDAKAPVLIGPFSRGGKSRRGTKGADHDFKPWGKLTPFGIFLPDQKGLNFYFTSSKVTSDFIVDRLDQWWQGNRERYPRIRKLLLDLDNGPENHSRRSQFIYRLVHWAQATQLTVELVYYPPYHSKYNPHRTLLGRAGGLLEWGTAQQRRSGAGVRGEHDLCRESSACGSSERDVLPWRVSEQRRDEDVGTTPGAADEFAQMVGDHCTT